MKINEALSQVKIVDVNVAIAPPPNMEWEDWEPQREELSVFVKFMVRIIMKKRALDLLHFEIVQDPQRREPAVEVSGQKASVTITLRHSGAERLALDAPLLAMLRTALANLLSSLICMVTVVDINRGSIILRLTLPALALDWISAADWTSLSVVEVTQVDDEALLSSLLKREPFHSIFQQEMFSLSPQEVVRSSLPGFSSAEATDDHLALLNPQGQTGLSSFLAPPLSEARPRPLSAPPKLPHSHLPTISFPLLSGDEENAQ